MANIYSKEDSYERLNLINNLKAIGRNYDFSKYTTAQLFRIYQKEYKKYLEEEKAFLLEQQQLEAECMDDYIQMRIQMEKEKMHPTYRVTSSGECYIKSDSGSYEYIVEDDMREDIKQKVLVRG